MDKFTEAYLNIIKEQAEVREISDDANIEEELNKAIENGETVKFNYTDKSGKTYPMTVKPISLGEKWGRKVLNCTKSDGSERTLTLSSIGAKPAEEPANNSEVPAEEEKVELNASEPSISKEMTDTMKKVKFTKGGIAALRSTFGNKITTPKNYFAYFYPATVDDQNKLKACPIPEAFYGKPIGYSPLTNVILLELNAGKNYEKHERYVDGDYDDGGMGNWEETVDEYKTVKYPDFNSSCGYAIGIISIGADGDLSISIDNDGNEIKMRCKATLSERRRYHSP